MDDRIHLVITTSQGTAVDETVGYVNIPTAFGSLGILKGHAPMLCAVADGILKCRYGEGMTARVRVGKGIANVADNEITLLVDFAELIEE